MIVRDEIAEKAYELWEKSGRLEGRNLDNWLEAERIVMAKHEEQEGARQEITKGSKASLSRRSKKAGIFGGNKPLRS